MIRTYHDPLAYIRRSLIADGELRVLNRLGKNLARIEKALGYRRPVYQKRKRSRNNNLASDVDRRRAVSISLSPPTNLLHTDPHCFNDPL
jgi:hypothetical protein